MQRTQIFGYFSISIHPAEKDRRKKKMKKIHNKTARI